MSTHSAAVQARSVALDTGDPCEGEKAAFAERHMNESTKYLEEKKQLDAVLTLRDEATNRKGLSRDLKLSEYRRAAENLRPIVPDLVTRDATNETGWRVDDAEIRRQAQLRFEAGRRAFLKAKPCFEHLQQSSDEVARRRNEALEREQSLTEASEAQKR